MKKSIILLFAASVISSNVSAEIRWSGFGSVVGGIGMGDDTIVDSELGVDGYNDEFSFKPNSFFAIQASHDLGENLAATIQVKSEGANDWKPEFSWAYLTYDINDEWRVLAGRQRMPHYMYSAYLDVSYAYHWITPPAEVYGAPFDSLDGLSVINTHSFDNSTLTTQITYGQETASDAAFQFENIMGATFSYNYDWLTLRFAHFQWDAGLEMEGSDALVSSEMTSQDFAVEINYNDWLLVAEYAPVDFKDLGFGKIKPWMVSVGKRFDSVMVHGTYGKYKFDSFFMGENTPYYLVGARWDFTDSAAFKVEYSGEEDSFGNSANSLQFAIVTVF